MGGRSPHKYLQNLHKRKEGNDIGLGQLEWSGLKSVRPLVTFTQSALSNDTVGAQDTDAQLFDGLVQNSI